MTEVKEAAQKVNDSRSASARSDVSRKGTGRSSGFHR